MGAAAAPSRRPLDPFVRYTVPAVQLRRMLAEAREAAEAFELEYTVLDGDAGDEAWRAASTGVRRVRLREDPRSKLSACAVASSSVVGTARHDEACAADELARMPALRPRVRVRVA